VAGLEVYIANTRKAVLKVGLGVEVVEYSFSLVLTVKGNYLVGSSFGETIGAGISDFVGETAGAGISGFVGDNFEDWS